MMEEVFEIRSCIEILYSTLFTKMVAETNKT